MFELAGAGVMDLSGRRIGNVEAPFANGNVASVPKSHFQRRSPPDENRCARRWSSATDEASACRMSSRDAGMLTGAAPTDVDLKTVFRRRDCRCAA
jgi:hypothetical protein